jgi:hypothetical protein
MKKCKHLIILYHETAILQFAQFQTEENIYKCKSCDRMFVLRELDKTYDVIKTKEK